MNCFYHQNTHAVGGCKHCAKGLCADCAADLGSGLACKNRHEDKVKLLDNIIQNNAKAYGSYKKNAALGGLFYILFGMIFLFFGWDHDTKEIQFFNISVAGLFFVLAIFMMLRGRKYSIKNQKE